MGYQNNQRPDGENLAWDIVADLSDLKQDIINGQSKTDLCQHLHFIMESMITLIRVNSSQIK